MAISPLTALSIATRPISLITPFTYRTGATYLEILERLRDYVENTLVPEVDAALATAGAEFTAAIAAEHLSIEQALTGWRDIHDAYMADVDASLRALNDSAVGELVTDPASAVGAAVRALFPLKSDLDSLASKTSVTAVSGALDTLTTSVTALAGTVAGNKVATDSALSDKAHIQAPNRGYSVEYVNGGANRERYIVRLSRGAVSGPVVQHKQANDSLSPSPARDSMANLYAATRAGFMVNAGGWRSTDQRMGLAIQDGVLIQGWDTTGDGLGVESAVFMKDGSLRIYDSSTPPATILADGGWNASSFGRALYKDGVLNPVVGTEARYASQRSARNLVGVTNGGTILFIMYPGKTDVSGPIMSEIISDVAGLNIKHLYYLDGGGSSQMWIEGVPLVRSSDPGGTRNVTDVYHFNAPRTSKVPSRGFVDIPLTTGTGTLKYRATTETVEIEYNITATFPVGNTTVSDTFALPDDCIPQSVRRGEGLFSGSLVGQASINGSGQITITNDTSGERSQITGNILYQRP